MTNSLALIIEDDEFLAEIFSLTLQEAEFEIEIIRDGRAALSRLAVLTPALVVLDLHLPYISGMDILRQIRADQRLAETRSANWLNGYIPVLFLAKT
jgi:two-component system, cell cycle response regulator DivK